MKTAYKALRNKVYSGSPLLALADFNGLSYLTNTYIAEENTELPPRLSLTTDSKPNLVTATEVKGISRRLQTIERSDDGERVTLSGNDIKRTIQAKFYDYLKARYPSIRFESDDHFNLTPVAVFDINRDTDRPVAFVMPLKT